MDFIIREMLINDINDVVNMMCDVFDKENIFLNYRHKRIKESLNLAFISENDELNAKYFVVEINSEIVGVGGVKESFISNKVFELCWMTVKHEHQNKGIGTALIAKRIEWAKYISGYNNVRVLTGTRVPNMFLRLGFVEFMKTTGHSFYLMCYGENFKNLNSNKD